MKYITNNRKKTLKEIKEESKRIYEYNKYVLDTALRTKKTISKFWAKDVSISVELDTDGIAFGSSGITLHNELNIQTGINRFNKLINELKSAVEELEGIKNTEVKRIGEK